MIVTELRTYTLLSAHPFEQDDDLVIETHRRACASLLNGSLKKAQLRDLYAIASFRTMGWEIIDGDNFSAVAWKGKRVVGVANLGAIRALADGREGLNLSYAINKGEQGQGLATHLVGLAAAAAMECASNAQWVNVQTPVANCRSVALVQRLGMMPDPERDFDAQGRRFSAYRGTLDSVTRAALPTLTLSNA